MAEAITKMRGLRSTLALLVALIGLGAYIYFVTWKQEDTISSGLEKVFASFEANDVQELKVKSELGDVTTLKKEGAAWQIVDPIRVPASEFEVSGITSAIGSIEVIRIIEEDPTDPGEYGLAKPRIEIEFETVNDKPAGKLLVGHRTPVGGNMYARRNDETRIFLVPEFQYFALNKSTFDLRDKDLLKIDRDKVDGIDVSLTDKTTIQFAKTGNDWKITKPLTVPADSGEVAMLVGRLAGAQAKSIVADETTPADLKKYRLDRPEVMVTIRMGSASATVAVGAKSGEDAVYARDMSKPTVVTVEASLLDDLKKPVSNYRRKNAFEFRAYNAASAEFTRSGQTVAFERVQGQGENAQDSWRRVSPNPGDADRSKMESLLAGLADIRATSFTDSTAKTGLNSPALTVFVKFEEGKKEERVTFGQSGNDVYFTRPDLPDAGKIDAQKYNDAIKALDELSK